MAAVERRAGGATARHGARPRVRCYAAKPEGRRNGSPSRVSVRGEVEAAADDAGLPGEPGVSEDVMNRELLTYERCLERGAVREAVRTLDRLKQAGCVDVCARVKHKRFFATVQRTGELREGFRFARLMAKPNRKAFNLLMSACARNGKVRETMRAFSLMEAAGMDGEVREYTTLISACAKAGETERAFWVYTSMVKKRVAPSVFTIMALLDAVSRDMKALAGVYGKGTRRNDDTVETRIRDQWDRALSLWVTACRMDLELDTVAFSTMIAAASRAAVVVPDALDFGFRIWAELRSTPVWLERPDATANAAAALMVACVAAKQPVRALVHYQAEFLPTADGALPLIAPTGGVVSAALRAARALGDNERCRTIYEEACEHDPELKQEGRLLSIVALSEADANGPEAALQLVEDLALEQEVKSNAHCALVAVFAENGDLDAAKRLYTDLATRNVYPRTNACNALIAAHAHAGTLGVASQIWQDMRAGLVTADQTTYKLLISQAVRSGDTTEAWSLYIFARNAGFRTRDLGYNALLDSLAFAGDEKHFKRVMDDIVVQHLGPNARTTLQEITLYATLRQPRKAFRCLEQAEEAGIETAEYPKMFQVLLQCCARQKEHSLAWCTYSIMRSKGIPPNSIVCSIVMWSCLKHWRLSEKENAYAAAHDSSMKPDYVESAAVADGLPVELLGGSGQGTGVEPEWFEWTQRAQRCYRDLIEAGETPRVETLSTLLAVLRLPASMRANDEEEDDGYETAAMFERRVARVAAAAHRSAGVAGGQPAPIELTGFYSPAAVQLYLEAQQKGIVPKFELGDTTVEVDLRTLPPAAADVCVLAFLNQLRSLREQVRTRVPEVNIFVHDGAEVRQLLRQRDGSVASGGSLEFRMAGIGSRVSSLLRRLHLPFSIDANDGIIVLMPWPLEQWLFPSMLGGMPDVSRIRTGVDWQRNQIRWGFDDGPGYAGREPRGAGGPYDDEPEPPLYGEGLPFGGGGSEPWLTDPDEDEFQI